MTNLNSSAKLEAAIMAASSWETSYKIQPAKAEAGVVSDAHLREVTPATSNRGLEFVGVVFFDSWGNPYVSMGKDERSWKEFAFGPGCVSRPLTHKEFEAETGLTLDGRRPLTVAYEAGLVVELDGWTTLGSKDSELGLRFSETLREKREEILRILRKAKVGHTAIHDGFVSQSGRYLYLQRYSSNKVWTIGHAHESESCLEGGDTFYCSPYGEMEVNGVAVSASNDS